MRICFIGEKGVYFFLLAFHPKVVLLQKNHLKDFHETLWKGEASAKDEDIPFLSGSESQEGKHIMLTYGNDFGKALRFPNTVLVLNRKLSCKKET